MPRAWRRRSHARVLASTGSRPRAPSTGTRRTSQLYTHALERREGRLAEGGPLAVDTGMHTGRSPKDKFVVREPGSEDRIWWGEVNAEISEEHFDGLREKVVAHIGDSDLYVVDAFAGADPKQRIAVRVVTNHPYHALFARTMFIDPTDDELRDFEPQALVLHAPGARGRSRGGRDAHRYLRRAAPVAPGGADRRQLLRRRDQEVDLHADERPPAARGRLPDALLGERRRRGRRRDLLRALRHREDDALGRSRALADRRRRARLGRRRRLQLRGRLLREGDPALAPRPSRRSTG